MEDRAAPVVTMVFSGHGEHARGGCTLLQTLVPKMGRALTEACPAKPEAEAILAPSMCNPAADETGCTVPIFLLCVTHRGAAQVDEWRGAAERAERHAEAEARAAAALAESAACARGHAKQALAWVRTFASFHLWLLARLL